jgi:hypothetical protein
MRNFKSDPVHSDLPWHMWLANLPPPVRLHPPSEKAKTNIMIERIAVISILPPA